MDAQQTDQQRRNINATVAVRQNTAPPRRKADPESRQWQITVIPSDETVYDEIQSLVGSGDADYVCIGREICPETHLTLPCTYHLQDSEEGKLDQNKHLRYSTQRDRCQRRG